MWWERWIPKSYLTKGNVCTVECIFDDYGISYNYVVLNKKNNSVNVLQHGKVVEVKALLEIIKKSPCPILLTLIGKGIIIKKVIFNETDSLELSDILKQHFPAISASDFFIQFYQNNSNSGHVAICRKEQINDLLLLFKSTEIANLFIGPLICNSLASITQSYNYIYTSIHKLDLNNGFIENVSLKISSEISVLKISDTNINSNQLVAFAAGLSYFTQQINYSTENVELKNIPLSHFEKTKTKFLLITLILFLFIVSGINSILFFKKFEENSSIEVELNLYESKYNQITLLLDNYQKKKNLIEQAGVFSNKKMSVYADKIASTLPQDIILKELYFNPEDGETEEDSLTNFIENQMIIKGNCNKSLLLNDWINILKSQNFIKTVNLETFIYSSDGYLPNFVLKIETK